jgi:Icc-related predicted phosphoesterase
MMARLQIFSDIHGDARALERLMAEEADYYMAAGDLARWSRGLDKLALLMQPKAGRTYVLPGNHESENDIEAFCAQWGFHPFHGRSMRIAEWTVAGLGYSSPTPFNTPGEYSEQELARRLEPFVGIEKLVLICHCPPFDTVLDQVRTGLHAGSRAVREFIERNQPERFFCGHIHEAEGAAIQMGKTQGVNVGKRGFLLEL